MPEPAHAVVTETPRLVLRHLVPGDLDPLHALYRDPETRRYFPEATLTLEQTRAELEYFLNGPTRAQGMGLWATILKETATFIGRCGLLPCTIDGREEVEVAYLIDKAYWGRGLGTEAARAVAGYGFQTLGLDRLISLVDPANQASRRVAERLGMRVERMLAGVEGDGIPTLLYAVTASGLQPAPSDTRG